VTDVEVRQAGTADVDALAALRRAWVEEQSGGPVHDAGFEADFARWFAREHEQRVSWLALSHDQPIGMVNLLVFTRMPRPGRTVSQWGYLSNFFVAAAHRSSGVGSRLLSTCVEYADAHDFVRVVLSPSERSRSLYLRAGFGAADSLLVREAPA
jgi:GNAT superfamily N-acetyltransferase